MTSMRTFSVCDKSFSKGYNYKRHIQRFHNKQFGKETVPLPFKPASTACVSSPTKIRDGQQISTLEKQIFPGNDKVLLEGYMDATCKYGYLVIDSRLQVENQ